MKRSKIVLCLIICLFSCSFLIMGVFAASNFISLSVNSSLNYVPEEPKNISVIASNSSYGTASGGGEYEIGETATLTATLSNNCVFYGWQTDEGEIVSSSLNYSFVVESSTSSSYTALFDYYDVATLSYLITTSGDTASLRIVNIIENFDSNTYFPSYINQNGTQYAVTSINFEGLEIYGIKIFIPSTISNVIHATFYTDELVFIEGGNTETIENLELNPLENNYEVLIRIPSSVQNIINITINSDVFCMEFAKNSSINIIRDIYGYSTFNTILFNSQVPTEFNNVTFYGNLDAYVPENLISEYQDLLSTASIAGTLTVQSNSSYTN